MSSMTVAELVPYRPALTARTRSAVSSCSELEPQPERTSRLPGRDLSSEEAEPGAAAAIAAAAVAAAGSSGASGENTDRSGALRLLAARLDGLTFAEVSDVAGIAAEKLRRIVHGESSLAQSESDRVLRVLALTTRLRTLLPSDGIGTWYRTSIGALRGRSPLEALTEGEVAEVERVVESYFDPSYA